MPLVLDGTNGVSGVDGTASNPAIEGTDSNTGIFYPAADTVAIGTGGTEALRVNSSQQLGFGVTPSAWGSGKALEIGPSPTGFLFNDTNNTNLGSNAYFNSGWKYQTSSIGASRYAQTSGQHQWHNAPSGTAGNPITFTLAMLLDASGNLGVSTSSPGSVFSIGSSAIYGGGTANESLVNITGAAPSNDTSRGQITLADTRAYNASPLFIATFAGKYNTAANYTFMSGIGGGKENTTDGNYAGYLGLYSRPNGGSLIERARITSGGDVVVTSDGGALGYGSGSGGTVTQATNKSTAVTLNKPSGRITMNNAALAAGASVSFQVFNNKVAQTDVVSVSMRDDLGTNYTTTVWGVWDGYFYIRITNNESVSKSEAVRINFVVINGSEA